MSKFAEQFLRDMKAFKDAQEGASLKKTIDEAVKDMSKPWDTSIISGTTEVHDKVRQAIEDLYLWTKGELPWEDITSTFMIEGEPGTGKTHLAREIKKCLMESGPDAHAELTSVSDWQSYDKKNFGAMISAMQDAFAKAKKNRPAFLFIDEIDGFVARHATTSEYMRLLVNAFLDQLNVDDLEGVIIVGACNDMSVMDPAILRDGRFDEKLRMELPDREGVEAILRKALDGVAVTLEGTDTSDEAFLQASRELAGSTPSSITGALRKLKSDCRRKKIDFSLDELLERVLPRKDRREAILRRVAIHECGHAIVCQALDLGKSKRLVIRANGGGFAESEPEINEQMIEDYDRRIMHLMAGTAAEEYMLGDASGGVGGSKNSDLARATRLAWAIEGQLGFGKRLLFAEKPKEKSYELFPVQIDERLRAAKKEAVRILHEHRYLLRDMAEELARVREMKGEALETWLSNVTVRPIQSDLPVRTSVKAIEIAKCIRASSLRIAMPDGTRLSLEDAIKANTRVAVALLTIGWRYGRQGVTPKGNVLMESTILEGLDALQRALPERAILKLDVLHDMAVFMRGKDDFDMKNLRSFLSSFEAWFYSKLLECFDRLDAAEETASPSM
mgnify:CR=1 FL=1